MHSSSTKWHTKRQPGPGAGALPPPPAGTKHAGDGHEGGERPAVKLAAPARAVGTVGAVDAADKHLQLGHEAEEAHPVCRQTHPEMCVMRVGVS